MALILDGIYFRSTDNTSGVGYIDTTIGGQAFRLYQMLAANQSYTTGQGFGFGATNSIFANSALASEPDYLDGNTNFGSLNVRLRWDFPATGSWKIRMALGSGTSTVDAMVFDGAVPWTSNNPTKWAESTSYSIGNLVLNGDQIYRCTVPGTSAASGGPTGTGTGITDNTVTWDHYATPLLVLGPNTPLSNYLVDATDTARAPGTWVTSNVEVTINVTSGFITILSLPGPATTYLRMIAREQQPPVLADAILTNTDETSLTTVYSGETAGKRVAEIRATTGTSSFSLSGAFATYYDIVFEEDAYWLKANATRIPDALAGAQTLSIIQTDPDASNSPYTTNVSVTAVSTNSRPTTGITSRYSAKAYLRREGIKAIAETHWAGYQEQTLTSDVLVTDVASLLSAYNAISPTGISWHRIRLGGTLYSGAVVFADKSFGDLGGLIIENDAAATPIVTGQWGGFVKGLHLRGITQAGGGANSFAWRSNLPAGSVHLRLKISGCRIGRFFGTSGDTPATPGVYANLPHGLSVSSAEQVIIEDNWYWGVTDAVSVSGVRNAVLSRNICRAVVGDFAKFNTAYYANTPYPYADTKRYVTVVDNVVFDNLDYYGDAGLVGEGIHADFLQHANFNPYNTGVCYGWRQSRLVISSARFCIANGNIYEATTLGTTAATGTGPSGTGTAISDGSVVWQYRQAYTDAGEVHLWCEGNAIHASGVKYKIDGGNVYAPYRQFYISSNGGIGCPVIGVMLNNISAADSIYGINADDGDIIAEYNTFAMPSTRPDIVSGSLGNESELFLRPGSSGVPVIGRLECWRNITGTKGDKTGAMLEGSILYEEEPLYVSPKETSPNGGLPNTLLNGTFVLTAGKWTYPALDEQQYDFATTDRFVSALAKQLRPKTGPNGARLSEYIDAVYTVNADDRTATWSEEVLVSTASSL